MSGNYPDGVNQKTFDEAHDKMDDPPEQEAAWTPRYSTGPGGANVYLHDTLVAIASVEHATTLVRELNDRDEYEASFNLRWNADQRAIKRWQEANPGKEMVWPDHADLVVWLMKQHEANRPDTRDLPPAT